MVEAAGEGAAKVTTATTVLRLAGTGRHEDCCPGKEQQAAEQECFPKHGVPPLLMLVVSDYIAIGCQVIGPCASGTLNRSRSVHSVVSRETPSERPEEARVKKAAVEARVEEAAVEARIEEAAVEARVEGVAGEAAAVEAAVVEAGRGEAAPAEAAGGHGSAGGGRRRNTGFGRRHRMW